jgi:hypothetical protein
VRLNQNIEPEIELGPSEVAKVLNIAYSKAKRLMETNQIRSWVDTKASDGRMYLKTIHKEVLAYHQKKIESRELEITHPKPIKRNNNHRNSNGILSNKTIEEFFRTEIFAS